MRYLDLIAERPLVWTLFLGYMVLTAGLAWIGHRKTADMRSFAIGKGDMHPVIVGVTLAASIASTATFVINPGFVYVHGVSALIHLAGSVSLGVIAGLVLMSTGFRRLGAKHGAVTLPQWIGERYGARWLSATFAAINLASLAFVVLIIGGLSIVMQQTLGLSNAESLVLMVTFVFGYVFVGGAYAHAYTNTLQGVLMVVIALIIVGSGLHSFSDGLGPVADALRAHDPNLLKPINPTSSLFSSFFSVYVSGFIIGFALVCQPHIMTKALYVQDDRSVRQYLTVTIIISLIFSSLLIVGIYAHVSDIPPESLVRQDAVMTSYITHTFSPTMTAIITVALMAAGMSTLDGILVALSSMVSNDLFLHVAERRWLRHANEQEKSRAGHRASQLVLIVIGAIALLIAWEPPKLLGIFGQVGVYGIVAASAVPILFGITLPAMNRYAALAAAVVGVGVHAGLYALGAWASTAGVDLVAAAQSTGPLTVVLDTGAAQLGFRNPGVTATYGIVTSAVLAGAWLLIASRRGAAQLVTPSSGPGGARG
ncbi:sodium:solute symporter family transporter [Haliangium sp.]|uniref:sodium:solute symporter family transporter n=1 Tax=Haliangium sp. TaxID=2663208 RepID=UPI003D0E7B89